MGNKIEKFLGLIIGILSLVSCKPAFVPDIQDSEVTNITYNSAIGIAYVKIEDEGDIVERGFCWDVEEFPEIKDQRLIEGSGSGAFRVNMFNLKPNTIYYARAYALNRAGVFYGENILFKTKSDTTKNRRQIIADHTVVDQYDKIPKEYIDSVKKMLVFLGGESHAQGYRNGLELLEVIDSAYKVITYSAEPLPEKTDQFLRFGQPFALGEQMFTSESYKEILKKHLVSKFKTENYYDIVGFGWCWDMTWVNKPGGNQDLKYHVRWAGSTQGGPDGNLRWGLDRGDSILTNNRINVETYLAAVNEFNNLFLKNNYKAKFIFTTGPVDSNSATETGFQRELKHDYIRAYVSKDPTYVLFDYADILCYNNAGERHVVEWKSRGVTRYHMQIHPDNMMDYDDDFNIIKGLDKDTDHIGEVGALRIAKAMWWLLARLAGWDGNHEDFDG